LTPEKAQEVILKDYDAGAALARHPAERTFFRLSRAFYSNDWSKIPGLIDALDLDAVQNIIQASVSGHAIDNLLSILGRKQDAFDYLQEALRRSPYDPSLWWHISGAAFALGGPDLAFAYIAEGPAEFEVNYIRKTFYTLIAAGRAEEALSTVEDYGGKPADHSSALALVLAYAGRQAEAGDVLDAICDQDYEHWRLAWAMEATGKLKQAEAIYRSIDAKPGGPQVLMLYATSLYGGKFFHDLAWTPNLAARLAEAGVEPERLKIPEP
jgi:tetratricopeptide (TPR) repeat protein